ncbi:hypothetical protein PHLGIDRAFT_84523, partial [Phlebiopsis gigantea 11061_1 CR5-6]
MSSSRKRGSTESEEVLSICRLEAYPIVGVNACEREQTQLVRFDISMRRTTNVDASTPLFPFRDISQELLKAINQTSYLTLEALVSFTADTITSLTNGLDSVTVCGGKPDALAVAEAAEVKITRQLKDFVKKSPIP